MTHHDFETLLGGGASIAQVEITEDQFKKVVQDLSERFQREMSDPSAAYQELMPSICFVAGSYWTKLERIDRQSLVKRLQKLETTLSASMGLLEGLKMGLQHNLDTQVANILALTRTFGRPGVLPRDTRPELETGLEVIEAMHATVEQALVVVTMSSSREGRR